MKIQSSFISACALFESAHCLEAEEKILRYFLEVWRWPPKDMPISSSRQQVCRTGILQRGANTHGYGIVGGNE